MNVVERSPGRWYVESEEKKGKWYLVKGWPDEHGQQVYSCNCGFNLHNWPQECKHITRGVKVYLKDK